MSTKPEHHDLVRGFAKSLKPPIRLSLQALETLSVIAYKQPVTAPEISEIRGVDSSGVLATLLDKKLITTAGRKQVIGRPILYKTTKEFLLRFGLKDVGELPSMEEFEKMLGSATQEELFEPVSQAGTKRSCHIGRRPLQRNVADAIGRGRRLRRTAAAGKRIPDPHGSATVHEVGYWNHWPLATDHARATTKDHRRRRHRFPPPRRGTDQIRAGHRQWANRHRARLQGRPGHRPHQGQQQAASRRRIATFTSCSTSPRGT